MSLLLLYRNAAFQPNFLYTATNGFTIDWTDKFTLWKDTAGTSPVTASGDLVARADDKYGNGLFFVQATSGLRPVYTESGGFSWVNFSGGQYMQMAAFAAAKAQPNFIGTAAKFDVASSADQILIDSAVNGERNSLFYDGEFTTMRLFAGGGLVSNWGVEESLLNDTYSAVFNGVNSNIRRANTLGSNNDAGSQSFNGATVGVAFNGTSGPFSGRLYTTVWANINPTTTERDNLHTWMKARMPNVLLYKGNQARVNIYRGTKTDPQLYVGPNIIFN